MFKIPASSPGINSTENIFHIVRNQSNKNSLKEKIVNESYVKFLKTVAEIIAGIPSQLIDKTIEWMVVRFNHGTKQGGGRTK